MHTWFVETYRPLDLMVFPSEYTYEELDAGFSAMEASYLRLKRSTPGFRNGLLCDVTAIQSSSARNRQRVAAAFEALSPVVPTNMVGQAFVLASALSRGALTAVFWIKRPPWPVRVFARQEQALSWLDELFRAEGLVMPRPKPWWTPGEKSGHL